MAEKTLWTGPIIDAHHHFWDPLTNFHPWLAKDAMIPFRYGDYTALKRRYFPEDYFSDARGFDIRETVYIETEWDPSDPLGETRFISTVAEQYDVPNAIVAQAWLHHDDIGAVLAGHAEFPRVRSVRHKPEGPASPKDIGTCRTLMSDDKWRQGFGLLRKHGLRFDLQTPWWNLSEAIALANDFPDIPIILNHTGLPSDRSEAGLQGWHKAMAAFAECGNVSVKISGIGLKGTPWTAENNGWIVRETIAMFSPERAMFGSNFPVDGLCASFREIFDGFREIVSDYAPDAQERLFYGTAKETYATVSRNARAAA